MQKLVQNTAEHIEQQKIQQESIDLLRKIFEIQD